MTNHIPSVRASRFPLYQAVLKTLLSLTRNPADGSVIPAPCTWVTTRQISNALDISIYQARLILLELVKHELVLVSNGRVNNSLRWYPHARAQSLTF